ncbi:MAG: RNA polymerase sigma factor [Akkermansiaceae bacterium]|nr:RNA polymerase sigma factor [Verrucomicrobiales bacterium]
MAEPEQLPVQQAKAGEADAWNALFKRYQLPLYVYVFELVHDEQTSLDLVQETFISAVRHVGSLREDAKFGSWLFGIAHQKCIQRWRKQGRESSALEELGNAPMDFHESPDDLLVRQEDEADFMKLLNQLPLPQRSALLLFFVDEFTLEEIGEITGASVGTVKSRVHYGKKALGALLARRNP